jgi:DNA transposition AAA+ family ATPase
MKDYGETFKTSDFMGMFGLCQSCKEFEGFGVITGRSGFGKTYSLKRYAERDKVIYIECNECMTVRDLIKEIEEIAGVAHTYGSINDGLKSIKHFFRTHQGYLLIVDEADKLANKYTQKKLEIIRSIYDQSNLGVVLAGEPVLESLVERFIPRSASRIDLLYELRGLSENEVLEYLQEYNFTDEAANEMIRRATNSKNGCFRLLNRTFRNVLGLPEKRRKLTLTPSEPQAA